LTIKIDLLKNHPDCINRLAEISYELIGKIWIPESTIENVVQKLRVHLNENTLPITYVALDGTIPVGMCSLRQNDGIRPDLTPWLGSLVVDPLYQKQGIGNMLVDTIKHTAKDLGHAKLFLFAFDRTVPIYYARLGWNKIGLDEFKGHPVTVMEIGL
jgi:N-acetylglutamate synthase-like GNAT family acetyltransferase